MKFYLVGGAVRDNLLGHPVKERDWVVVGATPDQMIAKGYKPVGKDFPVFLHPDTHEEYALARTERKSAPGYRGFSVHADPTVTLKEDLQRRDLTINALAEDAHGNLIDYYGGYHDLKRRILRHTSPAFVEDPVRILRVARFAARYKNLGFRLADETLALMTDMVSCGEVDTLVPERVWQELVKALSEDTPSEFFRVLQSCKALTVIFPELECLRDVWQSSNDHREIDTLSHTLMVLDQAVQSSDDGKVRFAALTHDLGKGKTPASQWPHDKDHESHGAEQVKLLCLRLKAPKKYRDLAQLVARYLFECHRAMEMHPHNLLKFLETLDAFRRPQRFEQFLLVCEADFRACTGLEDHPYPQADYLRAAQAAAAKIDTTMLIVAGLKNKAFATALREYRIHAITQLSAKNNP